MQGIKLLVTVMSLLIVAGLGLLGYGLATKTGDQGAAPKRAPQAENITELVLPALSRIERMSGGSEGAALYVESAEGDYIYFVSPAGSSRIRIKRQ